MTDAEKLREAARWFDTVDELLAAVTIESDGTRRRLVGDVIEPGAEIQVFLRDLADRLDTENSGRRRAAMDDSAAARRKRADHLNAVLHKLLGVWTPCQTACTHVIDGEWTALGAANVLARHSADSGRSQGDG